MDQDQEKLRAALQVAKEVFLGNEVEAAAAAEVDDCEDETYGLRKVKPKKRTVCCCPRLQLYIILTEVVNINNAVCS